MSIAQRLSKFALGVDAQGVLSAAKGGTGNTTGTASGGSGGGGPKIASIVVTDSSYTTLDDTAVDIAGGYIKLTGSGFETGCQVLVGNTPASSTTFVNATEVRAQLPATTAGSYVVYLVNSDGGTAIRVNGVNFSTTPLWTTDSAISGIAGAQISIQLLASGASTFSVASGSTLPSGVTLSSTGLLAGTVTGVTQQTVYSFTILATDAEQQDSPRTFAFTLSVGDPLFKHTTLLLTGNGTDAAQNNTFVDSSTNALAVTRTGNSTQGSFSPYGASWSNYFSATGNYLTGSDTRFNISATNSVWTYEAWIMPHTAGHYFAIGSGGAWGNSFTLAWSLSTANKFRVAAANGSSAPVTFESTNTYPANAWYHVAVTRTSAGVYTLYINGVANGTQTYNAGGLTSGTTFVINGVNDNNGLGNNGGSFSASNVRFVSGSVVYTGNFTPSVSPLTAISGTILLTCQSSSFVDNSPHRFAITSAGTPTVQRYSPFSNTTQTPLSYSTLFDGSGDTLYTSANPSIAGNFTVECWVYPTSTATRVFIYGTQKTAYVADYGILLDTNGGTVVITGGGGSGTFISASFAGNAAAPQNQWSHIALVRNSGTLTAYLNGVPGTGVAASGTIAPYLTRGDLSGALGYWLGTNDSNWTVQNYTYYSGSVSNFRFVTGTAVYTSAFTPPTSALTAISGTQLLTCQDPTLRDNSTNNYTFSISGETKPSHHNPFGYTTSSAQEYSPSVFGASGYFAGSADYLSITGGSSTTIGTASATIEFWMYPAANDSYRRIITSTSAGFGTGDFVIRFNNGGFIAGDANSSVTASTLPKINEWCHVAWVGTSGTSQKLYFNGVLAGSAGSYNLTNSISLVAGYYSATGSEYFEGYLSDVRIVKGTALYTTPFIPPQAPLAPIANTALLLKMANAGIADASGKVVLETVGNTQVSTAIKKYGTASIFFDGTGDYLKSPSSSLVSLHGDFTIECWLYWTAHGNYGGIVSCANSNIQAAPSSGWAFVFYSTSDRLYFETGAGFSLQTTNAIPSSQWNHVAIVRSGSTITHYLNGVANGSGTSSSAFNVSNTDNFVIGIDRGLNNTLTGYIDDLRISKYAHYTTNFTPPQQALPTL